MLGKYPSTEEILALQRSLWKTLEVVAIIFFLFIFNYS